jgi:uncharacterized protein (TIRG00374 family)
MEDTVLTRTPDAALLSEPSEDPTIAEEELPQQVDLGRRFADWRTFASFGFALLILVVALRKSNVAMSDLRSALQSVNPFLFALAFAVYYLSFPLRTLRWRMLMLNANTGAEAERIRRAPFLGLVEILYLSWFANCVIPAKLGDVYRAYLIRASAAVSASRTVGTILAERVLDMVILFPLLMGAAVLTFKDRLFADSAMRNVLLGALGLGVVALVAVLALWRLGDGLRSLLPQKVHRVFTPFREGALHSFRNHMAGLLGLTVLIWLCEGGRLYVVLWALGLIEAGKLGPSAALFLALGSSVLTTIPFAPGGLGLVETFLIAAFKTLRHGASGGLAAAVALLDRIISYLSIVIIGFVLYLFSKKTRDVLRAPRDAGPGASGRRGEYEIGRAVGRERTGTTG